MEVVVQATTKPSEQLSIAEHSPSYLGGYDDVVVHLRSPETWSSGNSVFGDGTAHPEFPAVIVADGVDHRRQRSVLTRLLEAPTIEAIVDKTDLLLEQLLPGVLQAREFDAIAEIARPVTRTVGAGLLGFDPPPWFWTATADVAGAMGRQQASAGMDHLVRYEAALDRMHRYLLRKLRERSGSRSGALPVFTSAIRGGDLSVREAVSNLVLISTAGSESTLGLLGGILLHFAGSPDLHERLRKQPLARHRFIEEVARLESPSARFFRGDSNGDACLLDLHAANRDSSVFGHADQLDLDRRGPAHLAFGWGAHHCIGAGLARAVGSSLVEQLLAHRASFELASNSLRWQPYALTRQLATLPVRTTGPPQPRGATHQLDSLRME